MSGGGEGEGSRWRKLLPVMVTSLFFILGFSVVFIASGLTAFALSEAIAEHKNWLSRIGGLIIIVLGLHMAGVFRIKALYQEKRFQGGEGGSVLQAFLLGLAFAFGWTPCVGPILAGILALAAKQDTLNHALLLMCFYSLGLALPFFLTGIMVDSFFLAFERYKRHFRKIEIAAGALLICIGFLMLADWFHYLKKFFMWLLPESTGMWG